MNPSSPTRRKFLRQASVAAAGLAIAGCARTQTASKIRRIPPGQKLNIGVIGAGGRGANNLDAMASENIVALCDVDDQNAAASFAKYPQARRYRDFRKMLDLEKSLDAVIVSTPDHTHAITSITALQHGKHVYCEKPLAHSIYEVRKMFQVAARSGLVTQMGQQGHAMEGTRRAVEVIRSGAIGEVYEVHVWTDRPAGWWPQGESRPNDTPAVPDTLDWDLWLGPAPYRPYHPVYVPFKWRGRWDFGTGAIGDMGVHNLDAAYWALDLGLPDTAVVVESAQRTDDCPPLWSILHLHFSRQRTACLYDTPVDLTFYDGGKKPPAHLFQGEKIPENGSLIIGNKGTLFTRDWHAGGERPGDMFLLLPRKQFLDYAPPTPWLPRPKNHHHEFIEACKGGPKTQSSFFYAWGLTESLLVGQLALRTGKKIYWDAPRMRARGLPEADLFIRPQFRPGWEIKPPILRA